MAKITQKQLIEQLKSLKEIKPREEWAVLLKSQILTSPAEAVVLAQKVSIFDVIFRPRRTSLGLANFFSRRLAYAFAVVLFLIVGIFGFAEYTMPGDLLRASLTGQTSLKQDVATLNSRINDLAKVAKEGRTDNIPSAISEVSASALAVAKNLKDNPATNSQALNEISQTLNKTLADKVPGADLSESLGVKNLLQALIVNYQTITLTDDQKNTLAEAEDLYNQGKYTPALEKILLISK